MILQSLSGVGACFILAVTYVSSLYVWTVRFREPRDHPATIRRRFISAFFMLFVSPLFVWISVSDQTLKEVGLFSLLGLRFGGAVTALILPAVLTAILFAGPIAVLVYDGTLQIIFTHFHHLLEKVSSGCDLAQALLISCFQFMYTSLFGLYSAFLFARTGHFFAPFIAHVICNFMGFPDFAGTLSRKDGTRTLFAAIYVSGLVLWCLLLFPMTDPALYSWTLE